MPSTESACPWCRSRAMLTASRGRSCPPGTCPNCCAKPLGLLLRSHTHDCLPSQRPWIVLLATEVSVCLADCKSLVTASGPNLPASHRNSGEGTHMGIRSRQILLRKTCSRSKGSLSETGYQTSSPACRGNAAGHAEIRCARTSTVPEPAEMNCAAAVSMSRR